MRTVVLLTISNVFMTFAWYGHLKFKSSPLWIAILVSWLIAFVEYCFQVPANRFGHGQFSAAQLKIIQEVITLVVFAGFSVLYLREEFRWNYAVGFALILAAVTVVFGFGHSSTAQASTKAAGAPQSSTDQPTAVLAPTPPSGRPASPTSGNLAPVLMTSDLLDTPLTSQPSE